VVVVVVGGFVVRLVVGLGVVGFVVVGFGVVVGGTYGGTGFGGALWPVNTN